MISTYNPWLTRPVAPVPTGSPTESAEPMLPPVTGPLVPQRSVQAPSQGQLLEVYRPEARSGLWVIGAHGGAGETTFSSLVDSWACTEHRWPQLDTVSPVVVLCRSNASGLRAAQSVGCQWAAGGAPDVAMLGLVIIADAPGRLPRVLRDLGRVVAGGFPRVWHLPWVESWRLGHTPTRDHAPGPVRSLVRDLNVLTSQTLT